ncbi:MAG: PEP-CTERM sorting domain-containing protein [Nitrospirota bacterium]
MKKISLFICGVLLVVSVSAAQATTIDLTLGKGTTVTYDGARFHEFDDPDQTTVSSGTGVIDPFLTIQRKTWEHSFNSDYFAVLDATRPKWNHSLQISDLIEYNSGWYEFLLDINEPKNDTSVITQHELEVYIVPNSVGGSLTELENGLTGLRDVGDLIWDLDRLEDSVIEHDYKIWQGSGQNIDSSFELPTTLFSGYSLDDYVYLYALFGGKATNSFLGDNNTSEAGFEEYVLREGRTAIPEPGTLFLLGSGLLGITVFRNKFRKK